jgi:hypothetical protein
MRRPRAFVALCLALTLGAAGRASAQNLFEVQVFPDETLARGDTELEFHNVVMPAGTRLPDRMIDASTHVHVSLELSHGRTSSFETGVFVETSPALGDDHAGITGFHFRPKFRFPEWKRLPFHVSLSLEYAFLKQPGDAAFRQAIGITPILERHARRVEMSFNPELELAVKGPDAGSSPVFAVGEGCVESDAVALGWCRVLGRNGIHQALRTAGRAAAPGVSGDRSSDVDRLGHQPGRGPRTD